MFIQNPDFLRVAILERTIEIQGFADIAFGVPSALDLKSIKFILQYDRLDLGMPFEIGHMANLESEQETTFLLNVVPGATYKVKMWTLSEGYICSRPKEGTFVALTDSKFLLSTCAIHSRL